ncbi:MAG: epoxide hydrolase family protein [Dehalococcoidia bacterium]
MPNLRPFSIHVPDEALADLHRRLAQTRWPDPGFDPGWEYGASIPYMRELCAYWQDGYDWRRQEAALNQYPQFLCEVDGVDFHFWHVKGKGPNPFPLLLVHGWPGSIVEFYDLIGPLTDPAAYGGDPADAFDVVIPALPGYGWSSKPTEPGWGPSRTAAAFDTLMTKELGYARYGTQGGDWGGIITARMGAAHGENIAGVHLNFIIGTPQPGDDSPESKVAQEARAHFQALETAYSQLHGTKPVSLALAQSDSPTGIASWIVEKFRTWSDCDGDIESVYTKDQLLTNIMFYWAPNSSASSSFMYLESRRDTGAFGWPKVEVPVGVAVFPKEIYRSPRRWCEGRYNIQRWTEFAKGGHFAAMERPEELLQDVRAFFRTVR